MQMAAKGDAEGLFSWGTLLIGRAGQKAGLPGATCRSPMADVRLALPTCVCRVSHRTEAR
jgi:hypothetical protein